MPATFESYRELNSKWKATCRVLLGGEIGELDDYAGWLSDFKKQSHSGKSHVSGKETVYGDLPYSSGAKWISFEEIEFGKKEGALDINQVKDFDSLLQAVSERVVYSGNIILGNSNFAEKSTYVFDSNFVYCSEQVFESKYIAYTTHCVYSDCLFGCQCASCNFGIRANNYLSNRNFEVSKLDYSSDIYFSHGLSGCSECFFSFNLRNKRHCIGNLELPKEKYLQIKAALLEGMRGELVKKKRLPSLEELVQEAKPDYAAIKKAAGAAKYVPERQDLAHVEKAFADASALIFGKRIGGIERVEGWMDRNSVRITEGKSCVSGAPVLVSEGYAWFGKFPRDRLITLPEAGEAGEKLCIGKEDAEKLCLKNAAELLSGIAFFCPVWQVGTNQGNVDCPASMDSANCRKCEINIKAKNCSNCFWPRNSEALFGCYATGMSSSYCLKCYYSKNLTRCFELDASRNCSDCYFCHNVENCHDCLLCFNAKNLRNAIGNHEYAKEEFEKMKKMILGEIFARVEKEGGLDFTVFSLPDKLNAMKRGKG